MLVDGGEFKRLAIILFKVVLDVIKLEGFDTKLLNVELARDDEAEAVEEEEDVDNVEFVELCVFVLELLVEELCLVNTFCKLFVANISCNNGEGGEDKEDEDDDDEGEANRELCECCCGGEAKC